MKFKYFLRGLGVGIIFASIVCLTAYQGNAKKEITDEEIIRRAKELGMIEKEDKIGDLLAQDVLITTEKNEDTVLTTEINEQVDTEKKIDRQTDTEKQADTEKQTDAEKQEGTEKQTDTEIQQEPENEMITIKIERGASSLPVCKKLEKLGMIEDANDFDAYLIKNGYASKLRVGEHSLKKGMSYHDIAEALSDKPE